MKPAMQVVQLRQQHIICASPAKHAVKGVSQSTIDAEGITWDDDGVEGDDY